MRTAVLVGAIGLVLLAAPACRPQPDEPDVNPLGPKQLHRISAWVTGLCSVHGGVGLERGSPVAALAVDAITVTGHGRHHLP